MKAARQADSIWLPDRIQVEPSLTCLAHFAVRLDAVHCGSLQRTLLLLLSVPERVVRRTRGRLGPGWWVVALELKPKQNLVLQRVTKLGLYS